MKLKLPIKFKRADDVITIGGQQISQGNITPALYDYLIALAPSHADHFEMEEEEEVTPEKKEKQPAKAKAEA